MKYKNQVTPLLSHTLEHYVIAHTLSLYLILGMLDLIQPSCFRQKPTRLTLTYYTMTQSKPNFKQHRRITNNNHVPYLIIVPLPEIDANFNDFTFIKKWKSDFVYR